MASSESIIRVVADLDPEAKQLLADIRDRLPRPLAAQGSWRTPEEAVSAALRSMLVTLDGWIEGARHNHQALEHRYEQEGDECWRRFAPEDIRRMINDVARVFGVPDFPTPDNPPEDAR